MVWRHSGCSRLLHGSTHFQSCWGCFTDQPLCRLWIRSYSSCLSEPVILQSNGRIEDLGPSTDTAGRVVAGLARQTVDAHRCCPSHSSGQTGASGGRICWPPTLPEVGCNIPWCHYQYFHHQKYLVFSKRVSKYINDHSCLWTECLYICVYCVNV